MPDAIHVQARLPIVIQRVVITKFRPSWRALVAYNALAYLAGDVTLQIGTKQLAEIFSVSEMTLRRGLRELIAKKAVKVKSRSKKKSGKLHQLPNEYILLEVPDDQIPI